jgi:molybdopterin synthase catalytic subunit
VQEADFDAGAEIAALSAGRDDVGAVASFVGLVRADKQTEKVGAGAGPDHDPGTLSGHDRKGARRPSSPKRAGAGNLQGVRVIHRVGRLVPGDRIVFVAVASAHRGEAFAACEFIMDYLKTRAPFWKNGRAPMRATLWRWRRALGRCARSRFLRRPRRGTPSCRRRRTVRPFSA